MGAFGAKVAASGIVRAMRHRDYCIFSITHFFSALGFWVQRIGIGWLTWDLTHSWSWLGFIAIAEAVPVFLLVPLAGSLADRVNRLNLFRVLMLGNTFFACLLGAMTLAGWINEYILMLFVIINGIINALALPARMVIAPGMVPRADVPAAIGLNSILFQITATLGPACAGPIIASWGVGWAFIVNSASYVVLMGGLMVVSMPYDAPARPRRGGMIADTMEGVKYAARHASIAAMLITVFGVAILMRPYLELLPGIADRVFSQGAHGLSNMFTAAGVGGMISGFTLAAYGRTRHMTVIILVAMVVGSAGLLLLVSTDVFWLSLVWVALIAMGCNVVSAGTQMLVQAGVEDNMRGRVLGLYGLSWRGAPAVGALMMGSASEWFGVQAPLAAGGLLCITLAILLLPRRRSLAETLETSDMSAVAGSRH